MNAATEYLRELKEDKVSVLYPLRRKWTRFIRELEELNERELDLEDPAGDLKRRAQRILGSYPRIFWLNSKSMLLFHKVTVAPFEKNWGKPLRKVYRTRLSEILRWVDAGGNGLSPDVKIRILESIKREYESLAGKENIFRRYPCSEGEKKIALKIQGINDAMQNISRD